MNLYVRTLTASRKKIVEALAFAPEVATYVSNATGVQVTPWTVVYGRPLGTISWTAQVESQAAMAKLGDGLLADEKYLELTASAEDLFTDLPEDGMSEVVATAGPTLDHPEYASVVMAVCADGRMADAMAWGVDITNHVASVTGQPLLFVRGLYGPFGSVAWIAPADSVEAIDAAGAETSADPKFVEMIDSAGDLFLQGATTGTLSRRIA